MNWLDKKTILHIHNRLIVLEGGMDGVRDENMLESAINSPLSTFDSQDLYPSIIEKATRLSYLLICNHPFYDGNKRVGAMSLVIVLEMNGYKLNYEEQDYIDLILKIAASKLEFKYFLKWVIKHIENK